MTTRLLFPHRFRLIGWIIFVPSALLGLATMYADSLFSEQNLSKFSNQVMFGVGELSDEISSLLVIAGLLLIAFSKEKTEDEMIGYLRLEALQWSIYANYLVLAVAIIFVYDAAFFSVMIYNMFTVLLVFICRFRWLIYRNNQLVAA